MASYLKREISEWNTTDLSKWLLDNKYPGISELCQNNSLSGYDLFYITDDTLKNELGLNSFHERQVTMKLIKKLIYEHLKLNIINSNGDNVILTLDNNPNTSLGELSEYIGGMFNINPKDILYKDTSKTEVLAPSLKIVELLILYPRLYKTLNVFNMKDYRQSASDNESTNIENNNNMESKENDLNINNANNNGNILQVENTLNDSEYRKSNNAINEINKNINNKMNYDYKRGTNENYEQNIPRIIYKEDNQIKKNKELIYNNEYEIRNKKENYNNQANWENNKIKYKTRENYRDKENNEENEEYMRPMGENKDKEFISYRNRKNENYNDKVYLDNINKQYKNYDKKVNYYNNSGD